MAQQHSDQPMDDPLPAPGELLANLKELIELDRVFGIADQAKLDPAQTPTTPQSAAPKTGRAQATQAPPATASTAATATSHSAATRTAISLPSDGPPEQRLAAIAERIAACDRCGLCAERSNTVPGEGQGEQPPVLFIGEGPGADEDAAGRPFVGAAGALLERMINAMGLAREQVFIANVVKCRPPGNRNPEPDEIAACLPYLEAQVAALNPGVICTLGAIPLRALTGNPRWHHPAARPAVHLA